MERLSKLELKKLVSTSMRMEVFVTKKNGFYQIALETAGQAFIVKSQRDDIRLFKTVTGAQNMLADVGITSFTVLG
jgi:hypothetical protein